MLVLKMISPKQKVVDNILRIINVTWSLTVKKPSFSSKVLNKTQKTYQAIKIKLKNIICKDHFCCSIKNKRSNEITKKS